MATDTPNDTNVHKLDTSKLKPAKPPKPVKEKTKAAKPPKPPKGEGKAGKHPKAKGPAKVGAVVADAVDQVRHAAGKAVKAVSKPRGAAIGAAAATVGLIAGFVAVSGARRAKQPARLPAPRKTVTVVPAGETPAPTVGEMMAAARDDVV
ncbi:hypothetical protein [Sphingomonas prati]|uniref:Uncharacterized protein n=1 Tax=Sphingomonas prati TaxID=1843237 RepID=A0A7W9F286_9SPHN|nr:hypothetical protein [Sphingomonas prati]MBB5730113.1 hypothetical protein [Sphingomonas prati]GGE91584.1 hypothetical protein GCM10011404_25630 [Sphingomonas prati]